MIVLKTQEHLRQMRSAGRLVAEAHCAARDLLHPGVTTGEIDRRIEAHFRKMGAVPVFRGMPGRIPFPAACCISIDDEVVHGIPGDRVLREGELVTIDTGCRWNGWCSDAAWTYPIGQVSLEKKRLLETGASLLPLAVTCLNRHETWLSAAKQIAESVHRTGYALVSGLTGHGIGRELHEDPQVPICPDGGCQCVDFAITEGLAFTLEPILTSGKGNVTRLSNGWTVVTNDGKPCVHFEYTVAITENGAEVLTPGLETGFTDASGDHVSKN